MTKKTNRPSLGRGLSALISSGSAVPVFGNEEAPVRPSPRMEVLDGALAQSARGASLPEGVSFVEIAKIQRNPEQPRKDFKEAELNELSQSIKELGLLQPVLLRPRNGAFELVAGERRWRAAQLAGLTRVPAIVRDLEDKEALEISIVENVQRESLNPVEEARAYERLANEFSLTHGQIAERVGKDRSSIANLLRLLKLPSELLSFIAEGRLSIGHAKAILSVKEPSAQLSLARKVISENLSVRDLEAIVARVIVLDTGKASKLEAHERYARRKTLPSRFVEIEDELRKQLGTKVAIRHKSSGHGRVEIEYFSEEELSRVVEILLKHI